MPSPPRHPLRCPGCRRALGEIRQGQSVGRYFSPKTGVRVRPHEDGTFQITCPWCEETQVVRREDWARAA